VTFHHNNLEASPRMKYIVTKSEEAGKQLFIFPKAIDHDRMAHVLSEIAELVDAEYDNFYRKPVSAGFTNGKSCYGRSETLSLPSDKADDQLLRASGALKLAF
jgi:hypothetical protein